MPPTTAATIMLGTVESRGMPYRIDTASAPTADPTRKAATGMMNGTSLKPPKQIARPRANAALPTTTDKWGPPCQRRTVDPLPRRSYRRGEPLLAGDQLRPALLDSAHLEDGEGGRPGDHEGGHDDEAEDAEVEVADEAEQASLELEDLDQDLRELHRADEEGDEHRE